MPPSAFGIDGVLLADATSPTQWVVLAAALVGTAIVLFKPKFKAKKDPLSRSSEFSSLAQQRSVERQMQNLLVELSEMSRQVTAGLDTRAAKLDALIREADEKIAVLSSLQQATAVQRLDTAQQANTHPAPPDDPPPPAFAVAHRPSAYEADARHAEVYLLSDEGHTPAEIAQRLQRPSGEIQLILALRARSS